MNTGTMNIRVGWPGVLFWQLPPLPRGLDSKKPYLCKMALCMMGSAVDTWYKIGLSDSISPAFWMLNKDIWYLNYFNDSILGSHCISYHSQVLLQMSSFLFFPVLCFAAHPWIAQDSPILVQRVFLLDLRGADFC